MWAYGLEEYNIEDYERNAISVQDYLRDAPNEQDEFGHALLHKLVLSHDSYESNLKIMQSVIEKGADLEIQNLKGKTAFLLAVVHREKEMIEKLIEHGANVHTHDSMGNNALHYTALSELNYDFEHCAPTNRLDEIRSDFNNTVSITEILLKKGVDVNLMNHRRETPMMWAARGYHVKILQMFLEHGGNVHLRNENFETCLHLASTPNDLNEILWQESNPIMISELIRNQACVNCFDKKDWTPFYRVIRSRHGNRIPFLVKFINDAVLVNWRRKIDFYLTKARTVAEIQAHSHLASHIETCYEEIGRMRDFQLSEESNLCQFALRGVSEAEKSIAYEVSDKVLDILSKEFFRFYHREILFKFQLSYLRRKVMELHISTKTSGRNVSLNPDMNFMIASFLEIDDLFNIIRASWLETMA